MDIIPVLCKKATDVFRRGVVPGEGGLAMAYIPDRNYCL